MVIFAKQILQTVFIAKNHQKKNNGNTICQKNSQNPDKLALVYKLIKVRKLKNEQYGFF